jgi:hypothetical protein
MAILLIVAAATSLLDPTCNVSVVTQVSKHACTLGSTFGCTNSSAMWVDGGCRAVFECDGHRINCETENLALRQNCPCIGYNLSHFERVLLPKWVAQYKLPGTGNFSFKPNHSAPHPYATSDVAHVLCFTRQLGKYVATETAKDSWASVINSFQRDDGFYDNSDASNTSGGSLWHAAGYVPAGLTLLGRQPLRPNKLFEQVCTSSLGSSSVPLVLRIILHAPDCLNPFPVGKHCRRAAQRGRIACPV